MDDTTLIGLGIMALIAGMMLFAFMAVFRPRTTHVEFERDDQGRIIRIVERTI